MIIHELKLFPTLVIKFDNLLNNYQIKDIFTFCLENKQIDKHPALIGESLSSFSINNNFLFDIQLQVPSCKQIIQQIQYCINYYCDKCGLNNLTISKSWFNIQQINSSLSYHIHSGSIISGALYIHVDKLSSKLSFKNPNPYVEWTNDCRVKNVSEFTFDEIWFDLEPNCLFLFPSWLSHGSKGDLNQTNDRLVISFNTSL